MAVGNAVWGIDIGQCSLKALKLRAAPDGKVEAVAFDLIEHPKILSQPDADPDELIRGAVEKFTSRNDFQGDRFVVGVPGQQTFARFSKMPPVDAKKIPDLVRFEASQQIPFDIDDVVWDYQTFTAEDSPELEVGIFAMRKDLIRKHIGYLAAVGIAPTIIQTVPAALYNFCRFDRMEDVEGGGATVLINVGAQNTDLVIVEPNSAWTRNIPLGGNSFTEALVRAFKLSFAKAESLKRTAATSKYARQIFQAMRPIFAELVAEIQRSIGFYSSTHRDVELKRVLALGNAFRLPGLQKYLENNLTISGGVVRLEKFSRVAPSATINAPQFTENILTFAAAYGLAVQGLGLARIDANLLPNELARIAIWKKKQLFFVASAACLGLAAVLPWTRNVLDQQALASTQAQEAQRTTEQIVREAERYKNEYAKVQTNTTEKDANIKRLLELQKDKSLVPQVLSLVYEAMPEPNPLLAKVNSAEELKKLVDSKQLPRAQRREFLIDSFAVQFEPDIDKANVSQFNPGMMPGSSNDAMSPVSGGPVGGMIGGMIGGPIGGGGGRVAPQQDDRGSSSSGPEASAPGFQVHISGRLLYGATAGEAISYLSEMYFPNLRKLAAQPGLGFYIPDEDPEKRNPVFSDVVPRQRGPASTGLTPGIGNPGDASALPDPITGEDMSHDWNIDFGFKIKLGEKPKTAQTGKDKKP